MSTLYKYSVKVAFDDFLEKLLRVSEVNVKALFDTLASDPCSLYDHNSQRWKGFPAETAQSTPTDPSQSSADPPEDKGSNSTDRHMYEQFVNIASNIDRLVKATVKGSSRLNGTWVDCYSPSPVSVGPTLDRRPNVIFISSQSDKNQLEENSKTRYSPPHSQTVTDSLDKIWWSQVFTCAELKKRSEDKPLALQQLTYYVMQLYRAQLDRRFVLATTLCGQSFNVYLFDRTGIVATESIDIHMQPEQFIGVIAALSHLSPERLGWDQSMKVYQSPDNVIPSYEVPWKELPDLPKYEAQWVITHQQEQWVSLETLSDAMCGALVGRATLILRVIKWEDFKQAKEDADLYVMKQIWERLPDLSNHCAEALKKASNDSENQPTRQHPSPFSDKPFETQVLEKAGLLSDRVLSYEYVQSEEDIVDTLHWIRGNILVEVCDEETTDILPRYSRLSGTTSGSEWQHRGFNNLDCLTQTRYLLKDFGWPIQCFRNLKELLTVIADVIKDHESLFRKGILHQDVSLGNILIRAQPNNCNIRPHGDPNCAYDGLLIDFDRSKMTERTRGLKLKGLSAEEKEELSSFIRQLSLAFDEIVLFDASVRGEKDEWAASLIPVAAIARGLRYPLKDPGVWTLEDFGWDMAPDTLPDFGDYFARRKDDGGCPGTVSFMSHELLRSYSPPRQAIHDLESFWWVLLAIAYEGPGATPSKKTENLVHCLNMYFEDSRDGLASSRVRLFDRAHPYAEEILADDLLSNVQPYFDSIKPLLRKWWILLHCAFRNPRSLDFLYPYGPILKLLKDEINTSSHEFDMKTLEEMEDIRRIIYNATVKAAIHFKTCVALVDKPELTSQEIVFSNEHYPNNPYKFSIPTALQSLKKELILGSIEKIFSKDKAIRRSHPSIDNDLDDKPKVKRIKHLF